MRLFGRRQQPSEYGVGAWNTPAGVNVEPPVRGFQLTPKFGLSAPDELMEILAGVSSNRVSRADALSVPAVLKARNMIAGIPSTLPIKVHREDLSIDERNTIVVDPDPDVTPSVVCAMTLEDLLFESKSYWRVLRFGSDGYPVEARRLAIRSVAQHSIVGMPSEVLSEDLMFSPRDPVFVDGYPLSRKEVIRFVSPNPPLLKHAARAIRILLLLDKIAETYANDPMPLGYFTDREDGDGLEDKEIKELLDKWQAARKARAFGYMPQSLELKTLQWNAEQIQLVEARQHAVLELARATGLDAEDLAVSTTSRTYQNRVDRRTDLIDFVLMPYMNAYEETLSKFALPRGLHARFDTRGFLRSSLKERMEGNKIGKEIGAITDDEIREEEHRPKLTPAQKAEMKPKVPPQLQPEQQPAQRTNGNGQRSMEAVA